MDLWQHWLTTIQQTLAFCAVDLHLGMGLAVILVTLVLRSAFLPLTWTIARRAEYRRRILQRLKPALDRLKEQFADDRQRYAQETMKLYQREGVTLLDGASLFGALVQFPVLLGIFQVLRGIQRTGRFLWIENLARPDFGLAIIAGAATMVLMAATNPDLPEHLRLMLIVVPALFTIITALKFSAALSLYWTTTNVFSAAQAIVLRAVLNHRARAGDQTRA
jgi:YidC/Oxa1 family membrane protein insertase